MPKPSRPATPSGSSAANAASNGAPTAATNGAPTSAAARAAAAGPFSWDRIAQQTAAVYERVRA